MPRFRKKPVVVTAEQFFLDVYGATGQLPAGACDCPEYPYVHCHTLEGHHKVSHRDWVIEGVAHEHYPCKEAIFLATYAPVEEETPQEERARVEERLHVLMAEQPPEEG